MLFFLQPLQQHETFSTRRYLFLRHANQRGPKCQPTHHHGVDKKHRFSVALIILTQKSHGKLMGIMP